MMKSLILGAFLVCVLALASFGAFTWGEKLAKLHKKAAKEFIEHVRATSPGICEKR